MLRLNAKQIETKQKIELFCDIFEIDPAWAAAIAMAESSLGIKQKSPTKCLGVFQMSSIAMKDLLQAMETVDDDLIDIACGVAFLRLLLRRHGSMIEATAHFCAPEDRDFYVDRVMEFAEEFNR